SKEGINILLVIRPKNVNYAKAYLSKRARFSIAYDTDGGDFAAFKSSKSPVCVLFCKKRTPLWKGDLLGLDVARLSRMADIPVSRPLPKTL
ncbi:MAG: hypothetical protein AAF558_09525, partial [Verrucomicrobiota bacterium]